MFLLHRTYSKDSNILGSYLAVLDLYSSNSSNRLSKIEKTVTLRVLSFIGQIPDLTSRRTLQSCFGLWGIFTEISEIVPFFPPFLILFKAF